MRKLEQRLTCTGHMAEAEFETDSSVHGSCVSRQLDTCDWSDFTANGNYFLIVKQEKFQW